MTDPVPPATLHHEVHGLSAPGADTVVLAHAGFLDSRMWAPQIPALAQRFRVVTFDARGAGSSPAAAGPHSPGADLLAVLDAAGVEQAHLVGVSMGAGSCLSAALQQPGRVRSLVLASPGMFDLAPGPDVTPPFERFRAALVERRREDAVEAFLRLWFDGDREPDVVGRGAREQARELVDLGFVHALPHQAPPAVPPGTGDDLDVPVLALVGAHDWELIHRNAALLRERLPGTRVEVLPGTAHLPNLERPDVFTEAVLGFLGESA